MFVDEHSLPSPDSWKLGSRVPGTGFYTALVAEVLLSCVPVPRSKADKGDGNQCDANIAVGSATFPHNSGVSFEQKRLCSVQHESIIWMSAILGTGVNGGACWRWLPTHLARAVPLACNVRLLCPFVKTGACAMCVLLECCVQFCLVFAPASQGRK